MKPDLFLGKQLQDVITVYRTLFKKTFGITIILSFVCLLFVAVLSIYSEYSAEAGSRVSLLSNLWFQFRYADGYKLVEMSKSILLFVITFFSIGLSRKIYRDKENINVSLGSFFDEMKPNDFVALFLALVASLIVDYGLSQVHALATANIRNNRISEWMYYLFHFLRTYVPLLIFAFTSQLLLLNNKQVFKLKEFLFLLVAFWIWNTLAFQFTLFIRILVFQLLLTPVPVESQFLVESVIALPLIAVVFLGFHSVITNSTLILHSDAESQQLFTESASAGEVA